MGDTWAWIGVRARRLGRRIGRRGASLLFVGLLAEMVALSLLHTPPDVRAQPGYRVLAGILPLPVWGVAWAICGALCLWQAFAKSDRVAFAVASALMVAYGIAYLIGALTGANPRGWVGASLFFAFGAWLSLISTWPETWREAGDGDL